MVISLRHLEIIYLINFYHLEEVKKKYQGNIDKGLSSKRLETHGFLIQVLTYLFSTVEYKQLR
jgi:hypothetical protein